MANPIIQTHWVIGFAILLHVCVQKGLNVGLFFLISTLEIHLYYHTGGTHEHLRRQIPARESEPHYRQAERGQGRHCSLKG